MFGESCSQRGCWHSRVNLSLFCYGGIWSLTASSLPTYWKEEALLISTTSALFIYPVIFLSQAGDLARKEPQVKFPPDSHQRIWVWVQQQLRGAACEHLSNITASLYAQAGSLESTFPRLTQWEAPAQDLEGTREQVVASADSGGVCQHRSQILLWVTHCSGPCTCWFSEDQEQLSGPKTPPVLPMVL